VSPVDAESANSPAMMPFLLESCAVHGAAALLLR
jgi:hypothetical protein